MMLTMAQVEQLAYDAYRSYGWPMDPAKFLASALVLLGVTVKDEDDPGAGGSP